MSDRVVNGGANSLDKGFGKRFWHAYQLPPWTDKTTFPTGSKTNGSGVCQERGTIYARDLDTTITPAANMYGSLHTTKTICRYISAFIILLAPCLGTNDDIVQRALDTLLEEESKLRQRLENGVDHRVPDFPQLKPPMLSSHHVQLVPRDDLRQCKLINLIHAAAKEVNAPRNITDYLLTRTAEENQITCPFKPVHCADIPGRYRTFSGECNNWKHPVWGAAYTPFTRELPHVYESRTLDNGLIMGDLPRRSGVNGLLPIPRLVSNVVHMQSDEPVATNTTSLYTNFGQSLSHDISDTPLETGLEKAKFGCCNQVIPTDRCTNIKIPEDDFFKRFNRTCMGFTRSGEFTDLNCSSGVREQMNIASSYLDLTQVYGHSTEHADMLRDEYGLMRMSDPKELPLQAHPNYKAVQQGINYMMSGDEKVGEFPGLIAITTLLVREHNRIANRVFQLKRGVFELNSIDTEDIFFFSRKILIAVYQFIVYNEYLPVTLGPELMEKYDLYPLRSGYFGGYDADVDPTVTNVIGTAAMRFGHSMVRNVFSVMDKQSLNRDSELPLKKIFWKDNFYLLFENGFQRGVLVDDSEKCDRHLAKDLRDHMFETVDGNGFDLASLNIQRGRDHGLPSYNEYRRLVGLSPALEWTVGESGFKHMSTDVVNKLQSVYNSPEDVDVWTGGICENPVAGGQVGPLFGELLARQFHRLRSGDYYWFENPNNGLTLDQLSQVRNYTLSKMMCNNFPLTEIQPWAFLLPSVPGNERVRCSDLPDPNLYT